MNTSIKTIQLLGLLFFSFLCKSQQVELVDYIDSRIGTYDDNSQCVIGPQLPFGSINPSPQTPNGQNDGYSPTQPIRGFGQLHASGTGWGKYGQVFISPQIGLAIGETEHDSPKSDESAHPYEYSVTLKKYHIQTEVTPSYHSAIYRFIFPKSDQSHIILDLSHNIPQDIATNIGGTISQGFVKIDAKGTKMSGFGKYEGGFGNGEYNVYFAAEFSRNPVSFGTWKGNNIQNKDTLCSITKINERVGAFVNFSTKANDTIYMKVAVSFKSIEKAEYWLKNEIPSWNYNAVKSFAKDCWNKEMAKIKIETPSKDDKKIFYTALYHSMVMPRDRTSDMVGFEDGASLWDDHYAVWDTWRSLFPLMALINPQMVAGNVNAFIERHKKNTIVRDAYVAGLDMPEEQGGNNVDNVIADAFVKGVEGIDWNKAYEVAKYNSDNDRGGWQGWRNYIIRDSVRGSYKTKGWIPADTMSCSKTLEYAYNDYCVSTLAKGLGLSADYKKYSDRSGMWVNLWNPNISSENFKGFIVPKNASGSFLDIDLKKNWGSWNDYFYESNSWTYSLFVPHQFPRLVWLSGGKETFAQKLDYGFKYRLIDNTNEPAFLSVYSFIYAGRPDLCSYWARQLLLKGYSVLGYPDNDDSGAMSSWYVFNAMGFFPNAGQNIYYINGPLFEKITLTLANGKQIVIEAKNASKENMYIQSCTFNGKPLNKAWFTHDNIRNGATIKFEMGSSPSNWAQEDTAFKYLPTSNDSLLLKNK